MARGKPVKFAALRPDLQVSFHYRLQSLRDVYLQDALRRTVAAADVTRIDEQLAQYVRADALRRVASFGIRGEVFFPVPYLIQQNPHLLGYYRLLFGISQKEFYKSSHFGRFKRLEERGEIPPALSPDLPALCESLVQTAQRLVEGVAPLSSEVVHDLQVLTIGPQLRGSQNTKVGRGATAEVMELLRQITKGYIQASTETDIQLRNDSGRIVSIQFASDPDVAITEGLATGVRPLVSIEVKGGTDVSNIHNRIGEAEKSHQKARGRGFFEFITIVRVAIDEGAAKRESPTTSHFFHLDRIKDPRSNEHAAFRDLLTSIISIKNRPPKGRGSGAASR